MDYGDESHDEPMSKDMLKDICDSSQSHPNIDRIEARYKICEHIKQRQSEWKGKLKATQNMSKCPYKVFKTVVKDILQDYYHWVNLVYKFPISFQNPEIFLKLPKV